VGQFETKGREGLTLPRHALFGPAIGGGSPKAHRQARQPTPPFEPGGTTRLAGL